MRELNNPDHVLEYIIKDCSEAIGANPLNPKTEHYLALARACQKELNRRQSVRIERKDAHINQDNLDWRLNMTHDRKYIKACIRWKGSKYEIEKQRQGALAIGLRKLHLTKGA